MWTLAKWFPGDHLRTGAKPPESNVIESRVAFKPARVRFGPTFLSAWTTSCIPTYPPSTNELLKSAELLTPLMSLTYVEIAGRPRKSPSGGVYPVHSHIPSQVTPQPLAKS